MPKTDNFFEKKNNTFSINILRLEYTMDSCKHYDLFNSGLLSL